MRRVDRDESYLLQRSIPEPNSGCWLWLGAVNRDGYAIMVAPFYLGHRLAAFVKFGDPPLGTEVDHTCSVRCCVNPDHMRYVTHHENVLAGDVGGHNFQPLKTHCPYGHPLSGSNLRIKKTKTRSGFSRQCRSCDRMGRARKGQPRAIKGEV